MNDGSVKTWDIRERTIEYALRAINLFQYIQRQKDEAGNIIGKQYLRAATSIGANIQEAQSGESRPDFIHKLSISQKEARESLYWLKLLAKSNIVSSDRLNLLMQENEEIIAIITAIIVKTKKRKTQ